MLVQLHILEVLEELLQEQPLVVLAVVQVDIKLVMEIMAVLILVQLVELVEAELLEELQ